MSLLDRFLARLAPINIGGATLGALAHAITLPGEFYEAFVRETTGYAAHGRLMDPDTAPAKALGWLAQFPGVSFLPSDTEAIKRARIRSPAGFYDCTPQAMADEVKTTLTGTQYANVVSRVAGDRWQMALVTRPAETPDAAITLAAALRQKPAGIQLTHTLTNNVLWAEATKTWSAVLGAVTWANVVPGDV